MLKDFYESGFRAALEKTGGVFGGVGQTAASSLGKAFKVTMTKSVSNPKNLSTKSLNNKIGPTNRAGPATSSSLLP